MSDTLQEMYKIGQKKQNVQKKKGQFFIHAEERNNY